MTNLFIYIYGLILQTFLLIASYLEYNKAALILAAFSMFATYAAESMDEGDELSIYTGVGGIVLAVFGYILLIIGL